MSASTHVELTGSARTLTSKDSIPSHSPSKGPWMLISQKDISPNLMHLLFWEQI